MMRRITFLLMILCAALCVPNLYGHFFKLQTLHKNDQTIVLLSDYHYSTTGENQKLIAHQQDAVLQIAQKKDALVIAEDGMIRNMYELINDTSGRVKAHALSPEDLHGADIETPLHGIHSRCQHQSIDSVNVEFRYSTYRTTNNFLTMLENKERLMRSYDAPKQFKDAYTSILDTAVRSFKINCPKTYHWLKKSHKKIGVLTFPHLQIDSRSTIIYSAQQLSRDTEDYRDCSLTTADIIKDMYLYYGCVFIDVEILHAIACNLDKKMIIILAGDFHIAHCKQHLEAMGYVCTSSVGQDLTVRDGCIEQEPCALVIDDSMMTVCGDNHSQDDHSDEQSDHPSWLIITLTKALANLYVAISNLTALE